MIFHKCQNPTLAPNHKGRGLTMNALRKIGLSDKEIARMAGTSRRDVRRAIKRATAP